MIPNECLKSKYVGCIIDYGKGLPGTPGDKLRPGDYTDDTEQMLVLAGSLIDNNGFDVIDFSQRIAKWGKDALNDPARGSYRGDFWKNI